MKVKIGISIEKDLSDKLEELAQKMGEFKVSKSELVEAILAAYFKSAVEHKEKTKELVVLRRSGKLCPLGQGAPGALP